MSDFSSDTDLKDNDSDNEPEQLIDHNDNVLLAQLSADMGLAGHD